MWELDHKEGWAPKNWCFPAVIMEKTLESPLYCNEFKPVNPEGNQFWIFIGRTDAEVPILWPHDIKSQLMEKILMLGNIEGRRRRERQRMRWLVSIIDSVDTSLSNSGRWWSTEKPVMLKPMGSQIVGHDWVTKQWQILVKQK